MNIISMCTGAGLVYGKFDLHIDRKYGTESLLCQREFEKSKPHDSGNKVNKLISETKQTMNNNRNIKTSYFSCHK